MSARPHGRRLVALTAAAAFLLSGCQTISPPQDSGTTPSPTGESTSGAEPSYHLPGTSPGSEPTVVSGDERPPLGGAGIPECDVLDLPATAVDTIEDIEGGGPYEFPRNDGVRFQNREGILPDEDRDYYREFTVVTPNLDHRGARRIVTGGEAETDPDHWYYTGDHYESFCEFDPGLLPAD